MWGLDELMDAEVLYKILKHSIHMKNDQVQHERRY